MFLIEKDIDLRALNMTDDIVETETRMAADGAVTRIVRLTRITPATQTQGDAA